MKKIIFTLAVFSLLLCVVACKEEVIDSFDDSVIAIYDIPMPCKIGMVTDQSGVSKQMMPAEITEAMLNRAASTKADQQYVIPVVFHIFGQKQGNYGIIDAKRIHKTIEWINNDFNGVVNNDDNNTFNDIEPSRKEFVDNLNFKFMLARFDEDGKKIEKDAYINGGKALDNYAIILYDKTHSVAMAGPGNDNAGSIVASIAWDNKKYMNVYIIEDLYSNNVLNNSGVAWYPRDDMTLQNSARVVYNGKYLPGGTYHDQDFTSVVTHEFGHFMNLAHIFNEDARFNWMDCTSADDDGGGFGDKVADTPEQMCSSYEDNSGKQPFFSKTAKNCHGEIIDFGNYMNYGIYCNFTKGQVTRMKAALELNARKSLWQDDNVKATIGEVKIPFKEEDTFSNKLNYLNGK